MITPYHIKIAPAAAHQIGELPSKNQKSIIKSIETLAINPRPIGASRIEGLTGLYLQHVSQAKLIYKIENQEILILIVKYYGELYPA